MEGGSGVECLAGGVAQRMRMQLPPLPLCLLRMPLQLLLLLLQLRPLLLSLPHAVAIGDGLLESIVNAFAEDIVPSHEHRELQNMLGGAIFNKVREIIP